MPISRQRAVRRFRRCSGLAIHIANASLAATLGAAQRRFSPTDQNL
jgi:hypothetical protein